MVGKDIALDLFGYLHGELFQTMPGAEGVWGLRPSDTPRLRILRTHVVMQRLTLADVRNQPMNHRPAIGKNGIQASMTALAFVMFFATFQAMLYDMLYETKRLNPSAMVLGREPAAPRSTPRRGGASTAPGTAPLFGRPWLCP